MTVGTWHWVHPWSRGILFCLTFLWVVNGPSAFSADKHSLQEAQTAFHKGNFEEVLKLVEPLTKVDHPGETVYRLKILSLARLGKIGKAVGEFERVVRERGRNDEPLLRELAIASILSLRADMRIQMRGAAYTALKEINSDDVVPYLEDGLHDGEGMIRALAAEGLGTLPAGRRSKAFRQALQDQASLVKVKVLKALGRAGDTTVIPLVKKALKDKQEIVKVAAAGTLVMLGQSDYWTWVVKSAQSDHGYERGAAFRMLGELGDARALPLLKNGLQDSQFSIRAAAAASLGKLGLSEAVPMLIPLFSQGFPAVQSVAALSLGKLHDQTAVPALLKLLKNDNFGVRASSVAALLSLEVPYKMVSGTVQALSQHSSPGVRSSIGMALSHGRGRDVVRPLTFLIDDPLPRPRITAVRSLGRVGDRRVIPLLKKMLRDGDAAVRVTAAGSIARILSRQAST